MKTRIRREIDLRQLREVASPTRLDRPSAVFSPRQMVRWYRMKMRSLICSTCLTSSMRIMTSLWSSQASLKSLSSLMRLAAQQPKARALNLPRQLRTTKWRLARPRANLADSASSPRCVSKWSRWWSTQKSKRLLSSPRRSLKSCSSKKMMKLKISWRSMQRRSIRLQRKSRSALRCKLLSLRSKKILKRRPS